NDMRRHAESRRKALVVEERAADRDLGVAVLRELDYEAEATSSAREAVARLGEERFALLLLSSTLPDLEGHAQDELRRLAGPACLPIVLVQAADRAPGCGGAAIGAIGQVRRPISRRSLKQVIGPLETAQEPVLDLPHLLSFTDGDLELESELSILFLSSAEAYYDKMSRALASGAPWTSSAHALKGASANLGARRLAALARAAEQRAPGAADLQVIRRALDEVSAFFEERHRARKASRR
ncbi:MAG TPA: Hpt domain-containing protein, partial [Geminicoccaceae bacterium]|nr:Hpt domain-containing protein [Geminicoccaceae bacterium]